MSTTRTVCIFLPVLILTCSAASSSSDPLDAEAHLEKGRQYLYQKQYTEAIDEFEKAEALAPGQSFAVWVGLSKAYRHTEQPEKAIATFRGFVRTARDPEQKAQAYNLLGIWWLRTSAENPKRLPKSVKAFKKTLKLTPDKACRARINLAEALHRMGRTVKAREVLEEHPRFEDRDSWRFLPLGEISDPVFDELTESLLAKGSDTPVYFQGSVLKPEKLHTKQPLYTRVAADKGIQGRVVLRTTIDNNGHVTRVEVLKGLPYGLEEQAIQAVEGWTFKPATFRGKRVALYYNVTINFRLS